MEALMDVFIGWSGERSLGLAERLYEWLPDVVQAVDPWLSEHDIEAGAQWTPELMARLQTVKFAIMCVTNENKEKPWLNFEAGLAAKAIATNRVCPVLLDVTQADITGPLTLFQMKTVRSRDDMLHLVLTINNNLEKPRTEAKVQVAFDKFWPNLQSAVEQIAASTTVAVRRDSLEVAEETLLLLREQSKSIAEQSATLSRIDANTKKNYFSMGDYTVEATHTPLEIKTLQLDPELFRKWYLHSGKDSLQIEASEPPGKTTVKKKTKPSKR